MSTPVAGSLATVPLHVAPGDIAVWWNDLGATWESVPLGSGPAGPQGVPGPPGATGATGSQGPQGIGGVPGPSGPPGASGLTGATGPAGPTGSTGATGPVGGAGPAGPTGSTGATGATGAANMSGMVAGQLPIAATATSVTSSVATLAASFMPAFTGDVTSPAGGTVNTLATVNANVGTFQGITVNAKGLVTAASNQGYLTGNQTITLSGDVTGSGTTAIPVTLATVPVAKGGTNKTSWTAGSVVFAASATALGENNVNLFWDNTNIRLGIGTAGPAAKIQVAGVAATTTAILNVAGTTTGAAYSQWSSTSGNLLFGIESSAGGTLVSGAAAYSTVYGTQNAQSLHLFTNNTARATVDSVGGMTLGAPTGGSKGAGTLNATNVYAAGVALTSDVGLKHELTPLPPCLGLVASIEPKGFRWRLPLAPVGKTVDGEDLRIGDFTPPGHFDRVNWGFIAQDFSGTQVARDNGTAIDMGGLVAVLWQAVRELSGRLEALEAGGA